MISRQVDNVRVNQYQQLDMEMGLRGYDSLPRIFAHTLYRYVLVRLGFGGDFDLIRFVLFLGFGLWMDGWMDGKKGGCLLGK